MCINPLNIVNRGRLIIAKLFFEQLLITDYYKHDTLNYWSL